jgi:NAD(P)-dependent dehydrogenase (short-subunit alcohol dehydrogenase family)
VNLSGRTAVVTGAGDGIGRALALALAARGCHLALADIDVSRLEATQALIGERVGELSRHHVDVSDAQAIAALPAEVSRRHARVDLLFNNAGVAVGGTFEDVSELDFEWLFAVNFWGTVRMTRAFLPALRRSDAARIVNICSMFGLIAPPGQTAYAASKFAVRGFSEALRHELAGSSVGVTVAYPGGVATSIANSARKPAGRPREEIERELARMQRMLRMPPQRAGELIVRGVERDRARILVGRDACFAALLERLMPVSHWTALRRTFS